MEHFFEQILTSLPDGLLLVDLDSRILYLNPSAERICGLSLVSARERKFSELFPEVKDLLQRLQTTLQTGHTFTIREDELNNRWKESFVVEVHIEPIHDPEGNITGASLLLRDLSAFKKMEEEFRYADRLAVIGTIASGLAHEIKNPLGGIKGAAQMLSREVKRKEIKEYLDIIIKEANRVNNIITELLTFAKPTKTRSTSINVNRLLDEIIRLEEQARETSSIQFSRHFDPSLPQVRGDENQLKQVFLNLIKNSREAILEKGKIQITTRLVTDYQFKVEKGRVGRMVEINIADTGYGMDEETLAHLFSPFYTTKKGGTGLGLAISHRIISEHRGFIQVESTLKKGTKFSIFLRASS